MKTKRLFAEDRQAPDGYEKSVRPLILSRGLTPVQFHTPPGFLKALGIEQVDWQRRFYKLLQRYSVRLLFHDLLLHPEGAALPELLHYCSAASAEKILNEFIELSLVQKKAGKYYCRLPSGMQVGDVLEWFTATLLSVEFEAPALSKVSLLGGNTGGDYDVLCNWMGRLLFVEVKSAPPKGIHNPEVAEFLQRVKTLLPDIAVFLNDTHLRVKDKIVLMFEEEIIRLKGIDSLKTMPIERVEEQIFHLHHTIYIMNSKRDLKSNFAIVFRDYLRYNLPVRFLFDDK